ncbi:MAG: CesT family type III secretion system chaperone [Candidimonas sp.]|jgi:hypothetical protein
MSERVLSILLSELGSLLGIESLCTDQDGLCQLVFDRRHVVHLMGHPRGYLLISCRIAVQSGHPTPDAVFLRANYAQAAGGIVLARTPEGHPCAQVAVELSSARAHDVLELLDKLIVEAERWERHLQSAQDSPDGPRMTHMRGIV